MIALAQTLPLVLAVNSGNMGREKECQKSLERVKNNRKEEYEMLSGL